jgi:hypothetical protein
LQKWRPRLKMTLYDKEDTVPNNQKGQALYESDRDNRRLISKKPRSDKIGSIRINQEYAIALEQKCTHFEHTSTQNDRIVYGDGEYQKKQRRRRVLFRDVKAIATKKFVDKIQGITYLDVIKLADDPSYTLKRARNVLRNFKRDGKLYTNLRTKKLQEYFLSQEEADYAALKRRSTHIDPSGVSSNNTTQHLSYATKISNNNSTYPDPEHLKASDIASLIYHITSGATIAGMHKVHLHLSISGGNRSLIEEAYHERLAHILANPKKNQEKLVETRIDNYLVRCFFFPHGAVDIYIPCSEQPFPIFLHDPESTAINLIGFASQIRQFLCSSDCLKDYRGVFVPSVLDPSWQLVDTDLNFDVPVKNLKYKVMGHHQIVKFDEVFRVYKKMLDGQPYVRVEQDKVFKVPLSNREELGPIIVSAAKLLPQKLFGITTADLRGSRNQSRSG